MAGAQISTSVTIIDSLHGFMGLSLTEYSTSAAAAIAAGSVVEIAGAMFTFASDEAINASSWTAITTATTAYIALTPSGTAGSQVVTAAYTATAPTWRDDLQGWYASAASSTRVIGTVYKAGATSYYPKYLYGPMQDGKYQNISANVASVASTLSIASNLYVDTIATAPTITGRISPQNGIKQTNYLFASTTTMISVYTVLSTYLPTIGDSMIVSGCLYMVDCYIVSRASRISSSTIRIDACLATPGLGSPYTEVNISSSAGSFSCVNISW